MKLRPMTMQDAGKMLEWKNYPETRKFAITSHRKISKKNHMAWLPKNIRYFKVLDWEGIAVGAVRVQNREISIWIDRAVWGFGIATEVIKRISKKGYRAKIVEGNVGSMRAFIKAGYLPKEFKDDYYVFTN